MATLQERERLARELHDSVGQVLGFVSLQGQIVGRWMKAGDIDKAQSLLSRLVEVTRDAHADVRESILNLKTGSAREWAFFPALKQYMENFQSNYGIQTQMVLPEGLNEGSFEPSVEIQVLRVIQEAMINAQKHGGAHSIHIEFELASNRAIISIADDGTGFDPSQLNQKAGGHFGLGFMRERMEQIGGSLEIDSKPGAGTAVKLNVPLREQPGE